MTGSLDITLKRTEHSAIVRTGKSEAERKRLHSRYCTVEATKHRAASLRHDRGTDGQTDRWTGFNM